MPRSPSIQTAARIPSGQILIVTGKGGVGKSAVATALAAQSAKEGKRTLLTIYEREDSRHPLLGSKVSYELNQARPNLWVSRLDARLSMKEYIHRTIPMHLLYDWILDGKILGQFTDAAPGFDELMCLGKLYDLAEGSNGKAHFDRIIFDAPATGHCALMLRTPKVTADAVRTGPLHKNALSVHDMIADPRRTSVLVVALAEEMALQEGSELRRYVGEDLGFRVGPMLINRVRPQRFTADEIAQLRKLEMSSPQAQAVTESAIAHYDLSVLQDSYTNALREHTTEVVEIPQIIQTTFRNTALIDAMATALVDRKHIILCCGSGGVGKTTTSAALGFLAASRGRSVLVLTIDPAKRLAQALGLSSLSHEPQPIDISALTGSDSQGSLHGMMLDTKRTFDTLVDKYAPDAEVKQAILDNSYYQHISSSLAGSREFMAMERVYEIAVEEDYDLVVVDTPPSQHALDFIDAPQRMFDLFEGRFLQILLKPTQAIGKRGIGLMRRSSERYLKFLERLTGYQFLSDLSEFFVGFSGMFQGFKERSERVRELLQQPDSSFLLVCAPEPSSLSEAERFFERLHGEHMPVGGMIVNRVHHGRGPDELPDGISAELGALTEDAELTQRMLLSYAEQNALAHADRLSIASTEVAKKQMPIHQVPHFEHDLHSLEDIRSFAEKLY